MRTNKDTRTQDTRHKVASYLEKTGQKFSLSGALERNFDMDVKIVTTRGWACTM
jgi:hypothetical protein